MIFKNEDKEHKIVIATCNCGCNSELHIVKFVDVDEDKVISTEYYFSLHSSKWDEEQVGIFRLIGRRLKRAWYNLIGKDYLYMDIVFSKDEYDQFLESVQSLRNK